MAQLCRASARPAGGAVYRPARLITPRVPRIASRTLLPAPTQRAMQPLLARAQGGGKYPPIYQSPLYSSEGPPPATEPPQYGAGGYLLSEEEERDRLAAGTALRNVGWLSFWAQLVLTVVSAVILLFSVGVSSEGAVAFNFINGATLVGVGASLISTFLAWTYVRAGRRLGRLEDVKLTGLEGTILRGTVLNLIGMGATLFGLQATVGGLVAKTLSSAAAGAFYRGVAPPPVALDVFSVQACTNTVMAHWLAIAFSNWLLRVLNQYTQKQADQPPPPVMV